MINEMTDKDNDNNVSGGRKIKFANVANVNKPDTEKTEKPRSMLELIRNKMQGGNKSTYDDII